MSVEKIKELIKQLQTELGKSNQEMDTETNQQLQKLDGQLKQLYNDNNELQSEVYAGLQDMEYDFLAKHPVASNLLREMIEVLSNTGI